MKLKAKEICTEPQLEMIRDLPTHEYINENISLLTDFSKQNCLSAEKVIALLKDRRYNEGKESGELNGKIY